MKHVTALALSMLLLSGPARAIPRDEALVRARTYAQHPWHCAAANVTGGCGGGYASIYTVGDYVGLPYDWGGYASIDQFDQGLAAGKGVGSYPSDGILACTVGVDCSGFISRVWKAGHTTTAGMDTITGPITAAQLKPADAYNDAGTHVMLFERVQANGDPQFIESVGTNVHTTFWESWAYVTGFAPVRYDSIEDSPAAYADGTPDHPVAVTSFPFVDQRDTALSSSDLFDTCLGAAPTTKEQGPEVVYRVEVTKPGTLTAAVQDDASVDIDVHIYRALNELDCVARNDKTVSLAVGCGAVYVVADTYTAAGGDQPGPYTLTIDLEPSGQPCGAPDPTYEPGGRVGEPCDFDGSGAAPFCNPNLGAVVCVYSTGPGGGSFCSYPCATTVDCAADFPGGCCEPLDVDYLACLPAGWCAPVTPDPGAEPPPEPAAEATTEAGAEAQAEPTTDVVVPPDAGTDTDLPDGLSPGDLAGFDAHPGTDAGTPDASPASDAGSDDAADTASATDAALAPDADDAPTSGSPGCAASAGGGPRGKAPTLPLLAIAALTFLYKRTKRPYLEGYPLRRRASACPCDPTASPRASSERPTGPC